MRIASYLMLTVIAIVMAVYFFNGFEKAINGSVTQTAETIRKVGR